MSGPLGDRVSLRNAREAWGACLPDWVERLAEHADASSQSKVGKRIGYSGSVVNAVLKRRYTGDLGAVEKAVRGALMQDTLMCPVAGEIGGDAWLGHQRRAQGPLQPTSSIRVRLYRMCRSGTCPHSRIGG